MTVRYLSNKAKVGDGLRPTRIWTDTQGVQHFSILVDEKTERFSEVTLTSNSPPPPTTSPITVGSISVVNSTILVKNVSKAGVLYALANNSNVPLTGSVIEASATISFSVPAHMTTSKSIKTPYKYIHIVVKSGGQYSIDIPQRLTNG